MSVPSCGRTGRPDETNQLFVDHMMLALTAHVAQTYGGLKPSQNRPGGARAMAGEARMRPARFRSLGQDRAAADRDRVGLSVSHFSRAFRISTGLPPHQWLLQPARKGGKAVDDRPRPAAVRDCDLGRICQSKPFHAGVLRQVGVSPGAWRRETHGVERKEDLNLSITDASPARWRRRAARRKDLVRRMADAVGKIDRIEDGERRRPRRPRGGDDDRSQPHLFTTVLVRPSDRYVHGGVAGTVEQRHHAEADIACGDPAFEIVVQEVGRLRPGLVLVPA